MRDLRGLLIGSFATALVACSSGSPSGAATTPDAGIAPDAVSDHTDVLMKDLSPNTTSTDLASPDLTRPDQVTAMGKDAASAKDTIDVSPADTTPGVPKTDGAPPRDSGSAPDVGKSDLAAPDTTPRAQADAGGTGLGAAQSCASEPLRATGTVYYVCDCQPGASSKCVAGSDSNAGTTPAAPFQGFAKAASTFAKMAAGDTVALCRGGRWSATGGGFANPNCRKDNTCDLRDYAAPWADDSEPLPSVWINGGTSGGTLITFSHVPQHQEGFRVFNLDLHGTRTDTAIFFWNETTDVDLCNLSMDGFNTSVNMSGGDKPEFGIPANIVLRRSRITNNSNLGYIAVCDNCAVEDCYFDNNGVVNATTHSVYFASTVWSTGGKNVVHETVGMRLSRNEFHHSKVQCNGAPVVVHGRHKNVILENNTMDAVSATDGCWGLGVGCGGYPYGCWFKDAIIRGNTIRGLGNTGTENNNCSNCIIENNLIILDRSGNGITLGGERPREAGHAQYTRSDGQLDQPTTNAVVRNNTIQFTDKAVSGRGISVSSGTGHTLENNAIHFTVGKVGPSDNLCYGLPSNPTAAVTSVDYNVCEVPPGAHWTSAPDAGALSLEAWQLLSSMDKHSRMQDPMFSDLESCLPAAQSPLVNAGNPTHSPSVDINGRLRDSQPDIGALEQSCY